MKKRKWIYIILLAGLITAGSAAAAFAEGFSYRAEVMKSDESEHPYKKIMLTPKVYETAKGDLSDLRIIDDDGDEIPYFLLDATESEQEPLSYEAEFLGRQEEEGIPCLDFRLTGHIEGEMPSVNALVLETDEKDFALALAVFSSNDGANWEKLAEGTVFRVAQTGSSFTVDFPQPRNAAYYRLQFLQGDVNTDILRCIPVYRRDTPKTNDFLHSITPDFDVYDEEGETILAVKEGVRNLPLRSVRLETEDTFKGLISCGARTAMIYNTKYHGVQIADLRMGMAGPPESGELILRIESEEEKPISIKGVTLEYEPSALVIKARPKDTYTLYFGDEALGPPVYDEEIDQDKALRSGFDLWTLGEAEAIAPPLPEEPTPAPEAEQEEERKIPAAAGFVLFIILFVILLSVKAKKLHR